MQNEKQRKIFAAHEKMKIFRKKVDQRTKGTPPRKMIAQTRKYSLKMNNLKRKKRVKQEEKGPTKSFSYDLMSLKLPGQEITEISFRTNLFPFLENARKKKDSDEVFWVRGQKEVVLI